VDRDFETPVPSDFSITQHYRKALTYLHIYLLTSHTKTHTTVLIVMFAVHWAFQLPLMVYC